MFEQMVRWNEVASPLSYYRGKEVLCEVGKLSQNGIAFTMGPWMAKNGGTGGNPFALGRTWEGSLPIVGRASLEFLLVLVRLCGRGWSW